MAGELIKRTRSEIFSPNQFGRGAELQRAVWLCSSVIIYFRDEETTGLNVRGAGRNPEV